MPAGEVASTSNPQCFYVPNENNEIPTPVVILSKQTTPQMNIMPNSRLSGSASKKPKEADLMTHCDVCSGAGSNVNLVR